MRLFITILLTYFCIFLAVPNKVQAQGMTIRFADQKFNNFEFVEAIELYEHAFLRDTSNVYVVRKLVDANRQVGQTENVERWLYKLIDRGEQSPEDIYLYSQALKSNGKFKDAQEWLSIYAELRPEDKSVGMQTSLLEYIGFLQEDSANFGIEHLEFNSVGIDYAPARFKNTLVYTSTGNPEDNEGDTYGWDGLPFTKMYAVDVDADGMMSKPRFWAKELQSELHDGPCCFDEIHNRMYYNQNATAVGSETDEELVVNIYYAELEDGVWEKKGEFPHNSDKYSLTHPTIDRSGTVLIYASDMPGGYGGTDLYYSRFVDGIWSAPLNLGENVNTSGNEAFPYIGDDHVLYFSSTGHPGTGGFDIFMSMPFEGRYLKPVNMGIPVNSPKDDWGYVASSNGMAAYFASDREGSLGYDDIYKADIFYMPVQIKGVVFDRINSFEIPGAYVYLLNEVGDTIQATKARKNGQFQFEVNKEENYRIYVESEDFISSSRDISTYGVRPNSILNFEMFIELDFDKMTSGDMLMPLSTMYEDGEELQVIKVEYIRYDFNSSKIRPDAYAVLDEMIELTKQYPDLEMRIESHTDSKGSDEYNLKLSKARARSGYNYLVENGVLPSFVKYTGYGETDLLNNCDNYIECDDDEHEINRRSLIKVVRRGSAKTKKNTRNIFYF